MPKAQLGFENYCLSRVGRGRTSIKFGTEKVARAWSHGLASGDFEGTYLNRVTSPPNPAFTMPLAVLHAFHGRAEVL